MARFIFRSLVSTAVTMFLVSAVLFFLLEVGGGDVTVKILGVFATPEQRDSYRKQLGLDRSAALRYMDWLIGNDWSAERLVGHDLVTVANEQTGEQQWWAEVDGRLTRWELTTEGLNALTRQPNGDIVREPVGEVWTVNEAGEEEFWGVNTNNSAVRWVRGGGETAFQLTTAGMREVQNAPAQYIPLRKGLLRGDAKRGAT
jgi:peptide/nickel transport system permease protein